ncbi:MAG: tetratricopeptide repeat protein [Bacteroidia bacterium]|nr:tetratricopeptide repeat protein [Bacteroidia bacterium]
MKTPFAWTRKMRLLPFGSSGFGRLLLLMVLLWVGHLKVKGQDQHYLDSLKQAVTRLPADTNTVLGLKKIANYLRYEDAEQAILYAKRALELSIRLDYKRGIASSYQVVGQCYLLESKLDSALECFKLGGIEAANAGLRKSLFQAFLNAGIVYEIQGDYLNSVRVQLKALDMAQQDQIGSDIRDCEYNLGITYFKIGSYDSAMTYFQHSSALHFEAGDFGNYAAAEDAIGNVYLHQHQCDKAKEHYRTAIETAKALESGGNLSPKYLNLGSAYFCEKDYANSIAMSEKAKELAIVSGQPGVVADCYNNLGNAYRANGNLDLALENSLKAVEMGKAIDRPETVLESLGNLVEVCILKGMADEALRYNHDLRELRDSMQLDKMASEISRLRVEFEVEQNAQKLLLLQERTENAESKAEKSALWLIVFATSAIALLLILAVIALFQYFRKRNAELKMAQEAAEFNLKKRALEQRALRAQMNPHFIFNSLNSIQRLYVEGDLDRAGDYMSDFATILRKILDHSGSESISLAAELETLQLYLRLEEARLEGQLDHEITVDEDIDIHNTHLPPLILQPFVENAIWHGILPSAGKGKVGIHLKMGEQDNTLICTVVDDGIGIETSRSTKANSIGHESKGMKITLERLGSEGEVLAEQLPEGGTRITLRIPVSYH